MNENPFRKSRMGQTALEYLLLLAVVAVVVIAGFKQLLPKVQDESEDLYNTSVRAVAGDAVIADQADVHINEVRAPLPVPKCGDGVCNGLEQCKACASTSYQCLQCSEDCCAKEDPEGKGTANYTNVCKKECSAYTCGNKVCESIECGICAKDCGSEPKCEAKPEWLRDKGACNQAAGESELNSEDCRSSSCNACLEKFEDSLSGS